MPYNNIDKEIRLGLLGLYQRKFIRFNAFVGGKAVHLLIVNKESDAFALRFKLASGEHMVTHQQILNRAGNDLRHIVGDTCTAVRISFVDWADILGQPPVVVVATVINALHTTLEDVDISYNSELSHEGDVITHYDLLATALVSAKNLQTFDMVKTQCGHQDELNTFIQALAESRKVTTYWSEREESGHCPVECKGKCVFRAPSV
jgi:hypothetical protein